MFLLLLKIHMMLSLVINDDGFHMIKLWMIPI